MICKICNKEMNSNICAITNDHYFSILKNSKVEAIEIFDRINFHLFEIRFNHRFKRTYIKLWGSSLKELTLDYVVKLKSYDKEYIIKKIESILLLK